MKWILTRLSGLALMCAGIASLANSIIIITPKPIGAPAVLLCVCGILTLIYSSSHSREGWILIGLGIVVTFASGVIILVPTSLLAFMLGFLGFSMGFQLFTTGRIRGLRLF